MFNRKQAIIILFSVGTFFFVSACCYSLYMFCSGMGIEELLKDSTAIFFVIGALFFNVYAIAVGVIDIFLNQNKG